MIPKIDDKVLVVDDDLLVREMLRELLEENGWQVRVAEDWVSASRVLRDEVISVALLDVNMPGVRGDRMSSILTTRKENSPAIVLFSGMESDALKALAGEVGAVGWVTKGEPDASILAAVRRARVAWSTGRSPRAPSSAAPPRPDGGLPSAPPAAPLSSRPPAPLSSRPPAPLSSRPPAPHSSRPPTPPSSQPTPPPPASPLATSPPPSPAAGGDLERRPADRRPAILVVDDDEEMVEFARVVLADLAPRIDHATDWVQLSARLFDGTYGLILLDIGLPSLSGERLAPMIREATERKRSRILFWSGAPLGEITRAARAAEVDGWISKPTQADLLRKRVEAELAMYLRGA